MTEPASLVGSPPTYEPDAVEEGLNALIERRAANREHADEEPTEESYKASVREYHRDRTELLKHLWVGYYRRLARNHARLSEENERKASQLSERSR